MLLRLKSIQKFKRPKADAPLPEQRLYIARGAAKDLWSCRDEELLIEGPAGTGKTRGVLEKVHYCAMKYPGFRGLIVRKTRESLSETVLQLFEDEVVQAGSPILIGPKRNLRQAYRYPTPATIVVGGLDKPQKVMSGQYDMIFVPEATEMSEDDIEMLITRLRSNKMPYQQIILDCNPDRPFHWLNRRFDKRGTRLISKHKDNPFLYDSKGIPTPQGQKYLNKLAGLTGHRRIRLFEGRWASAEGMVYPMWDPEIHHIERPQDLKAWLTGKRLIRVIDFGFTNPFVCLWIAIDGDDRMYIYRELYMSHILVEDHAKIITTLSEGESYEATIADWDAEDRATLERYNVATIAAFKDITPGIEAMASRLRKAGDGRPRLFYFKGSLVEKDLELEHEAKPTSFVEEIDGYVYPKNKSEDKNRKEEPIDKDNHAMDGCRYGVGWVDNLAGMMLTLRATPASVVNN